jgi:hypothetical protein
MAATYVPGTTVGNLRLLALKDTDTSDPVFTDEEYSVFYSFEGSNMRRAIARIYETVAGSELYIQKVIKLLDITTDGASLAREFRLQAKEQRKLADEEEFREGTAWDIAEQNVGEFAAREIWMNEWLRDLT